METKEFDELEVMECPFCEGETTALQRIRVIPDNKGKPSVRLWMQCKNDTCGREWEIVINQNKDTVFFDVVPYGNFHKRYVA